MESTIHEQLKSNRQMEIMMTMMQMAKLPGFCGPYNNDVVSASAAETQPNYIGNPHQIHNASPPPPFLNLPSTVPFPSAVHDQPLHVPVPTNFLSCSAAGTVGNNNNNNNTNKWNDFAYGSNNINGGINTPQKRNVSMAAMREMIFRIAVMQPIHIDPESVKPPKRRNVKISKDPQSVAARHRRERISERIRILQRLVPGGTKMDTASMLDEAIHYVKFLKTQVQSLERAAASRPTMTTTGIGFPVAMSTGSSYLNPINCVEKTYQFGATSAPQNIVQHFGDA